MEPSAALDALRRFRLSLYECFDRRADALFELTDALLTAGVVPSPVHLSLEASHRRGWGSLYAALSRGHLDEDAVRELVRPSPPRRGPYSCGLRRGRQRLGSLRCGSEP
jgi:hypothetical protein